MFTLIVKLSKIFTIFLIKIDVSTAKPDQVSQQMEKVFDIRRQDIIMVGWSNVHGM